MKLDAPQEYFEASDEVRHQIVNGCGPGGWKYDLIPDTIWGLSIHDACDIHDWEYTFGINAEDKIKADKRFLSNMYQLIKADKSILGYILHYPRRLRAKEYYEMVQHFGKIAFYKGKDIIHV